MDIQNRFPEVLPFLPPVLQNPLSLIPEWEQRQITEIRLRKGRPLSLIRRGQTFFVPPSGPTSLWPDRALIVTADHLREALLLCCGRSLHSSADQLRQGFVTLPGGHRVGVAGVARTEDGKLLSVSNISSLNIRIAGTIPDAADFLLDQLYGKGLCGTLIAGPPLSGKTTILKSMVGRLSGGWQGKFLNVAVADERGELAGCGGATADILTGYPKAAAMEIALRSLSPRLLCCDELSAGEIQAVRDTLNAGVPLLCTVHAGSPEELRRKRWLIPLIRENIFERIVFLSPDEPGRTICVLTAKEFLKEGEPCA